MIDIAEYRRLRGGEQDFKEFLRSGPDFDVLEMDRLTTPAQVIDLGEDSCGTVIDGPDENPLLVG